MRPSVTSVAVARGYYLSAIVERSAEGLLGHRRLMVAQRHVAQNLRHRPRIVGRLGVGQALFALDAAASCLRARPVCPAASSRCPDNSCRATCNRLASRSGG